MKVIKSPITVDKVQPHKYKPGFNQAQLRQTLEKEYQVLVPQTDMSAALAPLSLYASTQKHTESRITWVTVPLDWDKPKCEERLGELSESCIYRVMDLKAILDSADTKVLDRLDPKQQEEFLQRKRDSQALVNPESGEMIQYGGKQVYRRCYFWDKKRADVDNRYTRSKQKSDTEFSLVGKQVEFKENEKSDLPIALSNSLTI